RRRRRARRARRDVAGGPLPDHDDPTGGSRMMRLIDAEVLKLRRRRGMVVLCAVLTVVAVAGYFAVLFAIDPSDAGGIDRFLDAVAVLAMAGSVAGVIVGATAGAADIE